MITGCGCNAFFRPLIEVAELHRKYCGMQAVHARVAAFDEVGVLLGLAVVGNHADRTGDFRIVRGHASRITIGSQVFARIKAKACCMPDGANFLAVDHGAMGLGTILQHE